VICHECLMTGQHEEMATAMGRFCCIGLSKAHLVELYRDPPTVPQYACRHVPARTPIKCPYLVPWLARSARRVTQRAGSPVHASRWVTSFGSI
jgi:hypothetical protein